MWMVLCNIVYVLKNCFCLFMHFIHSVLSFVLTKNICLFTASRFVNIALLEKEPVIFIQILWYRRKKEIGREELH